MFSATESEMFRLTKNFDNRDKQFDHELSNEIYIKIVYPGFISERWPSQNSDAASRLASDSDFSSANLRSVMLLLLLFTTKQIAASFIVR